MSNRYRNMIYVIMMAAVAAVAGCYAQAAVPADDFEAAPDEFTEQEAVGAEADSGLYNRSRYDLIVDRAPFGADPLADDTPGTEAAAVRALEKEYRLCFLLESQSGEVRAGFQNLKAKQGDPKSVMLMEGESHGSMRLIDIDLKNSSATLQYQGSEVTFELSKPTVAQNKPAATPPERPQRRFGGGFRRTTPPAPEPVAEPEPQLSEQELAAQREAVQENLREYQMEVLRQGMPPLPIQLTQEQDDQLVEEGVLPPLEEEE